MNEPQLLLGGRIWTGRRYVEGLTVDQGKVVASGTDSEARAASPTGAEVRPLRGRLVVPGLIDAHAHLLGSALHRSGVELAGSASIVELQRRLIDWADEHPSGPVIARGWDQERLHEHRFPTAHDLDTAVGDRPVVAYRVCGHAAILNTAALVAVQTREPPGAPETSTGNLEDGLLSERTLELADPLVGEWISSNPGTIAPLLSDAARFGLTALAAMTAGEAEVMAATVRPPSTEIFAYPGSVRESVRLRTKLGRNPDVHVVGVKRFLDGSLGLRTAALEEPYSDAAATRGVLVADPGELEQEAAELGGLGLQLAVHAIGDRAVAAALNVCERIRAGPRPRIEHASVLSTILLDRLTQVRPHVVVQPSFAASDWWIPERLGPVRSRWAYPFRSLLERGLSVAGSSDAPVESLDPWVGMHDALAARAGAMEPDSTDERLSAIAALGLYTSGAAAAIGAPDHGHLETGASADYLVTDDRSIDSAIARGSQVVREVWRRGNRVWSADDDPRGNPSREPAGHGK